LNSVGINCSITEAINISPSRTSLENYVKDLAVDQTLLVSEEIKSATAVYIGSDGGQDGCLILKIFYWWKGKVKEFMVDISCKGKKSDEIGAGTVHSFKKFGLSDDFRFLGSMTDSGGGGTLESWSRVLQTKNLAVDDEGFLTNSCTLHLMQLLLTNPTKTYFGEGGLDLRTALQLFHSIYYLQDAVGDVLKKYLHLAWEKLYPGVVIPAELTHHLPEPVMTRWWTVFEASYFAYKYWDVFHLVSRIVAECSNTNEMRNKIASNIISLMEEPLIYSDTAFFSDFHVSDLVICYFSFLRKLKIPVSNQDTLLTMYTADFSLLFLDKFSEQTF